MITERSNDIAACLKHAARLTFRFWNNLMWNSDNRISSGRFESAHAKCFDGFLSSSGRMIYGVKFTLVYPR